jgi:hypothetical protein
MDRGRGIVRRGKIVYAQLGKKVERKKQLSRKAKKDTEFSFTKQKRKHIF